MSLDAALRRLSPHKRKPAARALFTADEASSVLGMPIGSIVGIDPVKIGSRLYRYRARDLGIRHPRPKDATVQQVAKRWGVSVGVIRRMIARNALETRATKPVLVTGASIRKSEKGK